MKNLEAFIEHYIAANRVHTKSLISTVFGDLVIPNDGYTWIECLGRMLEPLGINERLVRTSLFRLREENWVYPTRAGRRSYYRLTDTAVSKTKLAEQLIYHQQDQQWDGTWTLVFLVDTDIADDVRRELLQELQWVGFGTVTRKVLAHPGEASAMVSECIKRLGLSGKIIVMNSKNMHDIELGFTSDDRELARRCLPYAESEQCYADFLSSFTPLLDKSREALLIL